MRKPLLMLSLQTESLDISSDDNKDGSDAKQTLLELNIEELDGLIKKLKEAQSVSILKNL
jgi:hypothetical protein